MKEHPLVTEYRRAFLENKLIEVSSYEFSEKSKYHLLKRIGDTKYINGGMTNLDQTLVIELTTCNRFIDVHKFKNEKFILININVDVREIELPPDFWTYNWKLYYIIKTKEEKKFLD